MEDLYFEPRRIAAKLLDHLKNKDAADANGSDATDTVVGNDDTRTNAASAATGFLSREAFKTGLQEFFPEKSDIQTDKVRGPKLVSLHAQSQQPTVCCSRDRYRQTVWTVKREGVLVRGFQYRSGLKNTTASSFFRGAEPHAWEGIEPRSGCLVCAACAPGK